MRHKFREMNRRERFIAGGCCLLLLMTACYFYFGQDRTIKKKIRRDLPLVKVQTIVRQDMMRHISLSGQTVADANIPLAPKYTGRIMAVHVQLGDEVKAGQVLLVQDTGDLDISIDQNAAAANAARADAREAAASYDANYIKAQNAYVLEKGKYERNQYLYSIGAISQDTLDSVQQEYMASKAAYEVLANQAQDGDAASVQSKQFTAEKQEYATDALIRQRGDMILRAPRDGIIGYRNAEVGAIVTAGTKVLSLVDNSHINVDCTLSEGDAAILQSGMPVQVTIDALGQDFDGQIVYVSPAMDDSSKTYQVRIELSENDQDIKAGLFAHTSIDILQRRDALFVPKEAVLSRNGRQTLFVLLTDGTVEEREVKIGLINDTSEEILDGLQDGETVVLTNQDKLKNGARVEVAEEDMEADGE
ncbi:efflux RND transporter periplasmic adaptor subunit [Selenomonas sp. WCA-380-WT-3B 3/]|uniref:Efflux RND transporter periplasmic adaptor subunit n=1 Tax=Selenomonas montiformis TaxID=2652285 RepID=A0A6I2UWV4_9FIRM|nr:efflux RND transporter periplasmic adaptor subunit [Selenomonas montiformis]MSV24855.1 efflux RND transporter periplasmic adaptor subunit [Selenomonas montiformis]